MLFNMAKNNLKKSFKDYTIYFLTLSFAVCIFYSFNAIGSQEFMKTLSGSQKDYVEVMQNITNVLSVFVSIILCALIVYANNFLIKRRKKELGIYMSLGMSKGMISRILVLETFIVGVISFVIGIVCGLFVSQGLSMLVAKLFGGQISKISFVLSPDSIIKTLIYFGIIFILVMIFNTIVVTKYKLIDLLTAGRKNEKIKIKNKKLLLVIFIVGLLFLIGGYTLITKNGMNSQGILYLSVALGSVGTFLFFYGLSGFIVVISENNKNRYLRGLNIFVTKQMNSKINTNFVSMALISLMLFITISALSTGVSIQNGLTESLKGNTPYDVSLSVYANKGETPTINQATKDVNSVYADFNKEVNYYSYINYNDNSGSIVSSTGQLDNQYINYITLDGYNSYLKFDGKPEITLPNNGVLVIAKDSKIVASLNKILGANAKLNINKNTYNIENKTAVEATLENSSITQKVITIVVPNDFVKENLSNVGDNATVVVNGNVKSGYNQATVENAIQNKADLLLQNYKSGDSIMLFASNRDYLISQNQGMSTIILFIAIYLGIVFLLTSSVILALQQLVEATDSKERYAILRKIGATESMINKAILKQVVTAFMLPLVLAIVDSIVGINAVSDFVESFGQGSIVVPAIITGGVILVVYGGYMLATFIGFKNAVKID
ncbi:MAG: FtsX-like permease family protein [Sarcina sp.]